MPTVRSSGLLRDVATLPCVGGAFPQRDRFRRGALDLIGRENLLNAAYCYRIVPLDEPPSNVLRVKEALLSMLAGDIFGKTPIRPSLLVFKAIYYVASLANLKRSIAAWRRRKANMRPVNDPETVGSR